MTNSKKLDLVSVVIPCFNAGSTIKKSIESVAKQSYPNIEMIVVDDGSTDKFTLQKLDEIKNLQALRVINHESNRGLPAARNSGFEAAQGSFVIFLDSDDWFSSNTIELMIESASSCSSRYFLYPDIIFEGSRSGYSRRVYRPFSQLALNQFPYSLMLRKDSINWGLPYDENFKLGLEDWNFNLNLISREFKPIRVSGAALHYTVGPNSMFRKTTQKHFFSIWKQIRKLNSPLYSTKYLCKSIMLEAKKANLRKITLATFMLVISKVPFTKLLDLIFSAWLNIIKKLSLLTIWSKD